MTCTIYILTPLLFNEYEGNSVKNVVKQAINEIKNKKNEKEEW